MVVVLPLLHNHRRRSLIGLATTFIIFIITVSQLMRVFSSTAKTTGLNDSILVHYVEVDSGTPGVTRYAAVQRTSGDSTIPISVQSWMTMVASASSSSPDTSSVARDLSTIIASSSYESLFFETPGTSYETSDDVPFEFVLVNNPALKIFAERNANRNAFEEHFFKEDEEEKLVCSFMNIGGDAYLVSPLPLFKEVDNDVTYSHLAKFVRDAPLNQVLEFWRMAALTYLNVLKHKHQESVVNNETPPRKTWFSTNGMGVAWLHLRIDDRPKYYSYAPFMS